MKTGTVYSRDLAAGTLTKTDDGEYVFRYSPAYFDNPALPPISATLPKTQMEYRAKHLFPFFFGLLAEGYQKERQCRELHIDENDEFTRLLETSAYGAIGAVYVKALPTATSPHATKHWGSTRRQTSSSSASASALMRRTCGSTCNSSTVNHLQWTRQS